MASLHATWKVTGDWDGLMPNRVVQVEPYTSDSSIRNPHMSHGLLKCRVGSHTFFNDVSVVRLLVTLSSESAKIAVHVES